MRVKLCIFDRLYYYAHLLETREIVFDGNEIYIDKDGIIKEFGSEGCNVEINIDKRFVLDRYEYCIEIILNKWNDIEIYRGLYRLGKEIFINEIYSVIIRYIKVY